MRGCSRVSPGCEHCYAEQIAGRFSGPGRPFYGYAEKKTTTGWHAKWTRKVSLIGDQLDTPLRWRRGRRIFVNSMSDTFHEALSFEDIAAVFGVMAACPQHTFQVLTKRAERMAEWFAWASKQNQYAGAPSDPAQVMQCIAIDRHGTSGSRLMRGEEPTWPLPNVWLGVSVEDQQRADERIPHLLRVPAAVRFLSVEPQLGPVDLRRYLGRGTCVDCPVLAGAKCPWSCVNRERHDHTIEGYGIGWVIQGGESGSKARPFDLAWARDLRDQCKAAGVHYFLKQLGSFPVSREHAPGEGEALRAAVDRLGVRLRIADSHGADENEWPADLQGQRAFPVPR